MLFLLKRDGRTALAALVVLAGLGLGLRALVRGGPALAFSWRSAGLGLAVFVAMLLSDGLLHGIFWLALGERYRALGRSSRARQRLPC